MIGIKSGADALVIAFFVDALSHRRASMSAFLDSQEGKHATAEQAIRVIVVGAGSAGCVLAARLTENPERRVLLLEAGSSKPLAAMDIPPAWPTLVGSSADWADYSVRQAATGTVVRLPRGRALGGSSAINGMLFTRGQRATYDRWAEEGATGWNFDSLLPYFQRSEHAIGRDPSVRGMQGPMVVRPAVQPNPVLISAVEAATKAGVRQASDISSGLEEGVGFHDLTIAAGGRQSVAHAYLLPVLDRPNLDVVTDALVERVRLHRGRCTGVEYTKDSVTVTVDAGEDVILSAGTMGSPKILMLSGIGPADSLRKVGINVAHYLTGVGKNLHDHPMSSIVYRAKRPVPEGRNNHGEATAVLRSDATVATPDLQALFVDAAYQGPGSPPPTSNGYSIAPSLMTPHSRGRIQLRSSSASDAPLLDPNYYEDPRDLVTMTAGLRIMRKIGEERALASWKGEEILPGPDVDSDKEVREYLRSSTVTYFHYVGTCRIGTSDAAVVDPMCRVHGISGLRVVDASIIPSIISGNTNATVVGLAERAASIIAS